MQYDLYAITIFLSLLQCCAEPAKYEWQGPGLVVSMTAARVTGFIEYDSGNFDTVH